MTDEIRYPSVRQILLLAREVLRLDVEVRDMGLLDAAVHRPQATVFGQDAYPSVYDKAAALLHSLVSNHPLVDGNKRLGFLAATTFLAWNGVQFDADDDTATDLVFAVARGELDDVPKIAALLAEHCGPASS